MSIRETFSNSIELTGIGKYDKGDVMQIWTVLGHVYYVASRRGSLKRHFLDIYLTTFAESVTSKIQNVWGLSFPSKCLKFSLDFKNAAKTEKKKNHVSDIFASDMVSLNCLH